MIEQSLFGDDRIKHLQRPARLRSLPSLVAYDKGGEVGLWYLPSEPGHGNQGFEIEVPKLVIIKPGEAPVDDRCPTSARSAENDRLWRILLKNSRPELVRSS